VCVCTQKASSANWRLIPIHVALRRSKVVFDDPASPSISRTQFDGDIKPDMTSLVSHGTAMIDRAYHHVTTSPNEMNHKNVTKVNESPLDSRYGLLIIIHVRRLV